MEKQTIKKNQIKWALAHSIVFLISFYIKCESIPKIPVHYVL